MRRTEKSPYETSGSIDEPVTNSSVIYGRGISSEGKYHKLQLTKSHADRLHQVGKQAVVFIVTGLLWWGYIAPEFIGRDALPAEHAAGFAGVTVLLIAAAQFLSAYFPGVSDISSGQKSFGFLLFWFRATFFLSLFWRLPVLLVPSIRKNLKNVNDGNLLWAIIWWCYSLSDEEFMQYSSRTILFESLWLLINAVGCLGLFRARQKRWREALVLFIICSTCQAYHSALYVFITYYTENSQPAVYRGLNFYIFWGFNGMQGALSLFALYLSWHTLFSLIKYDK